MIVEDLTTCHTQYTWDSSICIFFYLIEQHSKFLWHTLQVLYMCALCDCRWAIVTDRHTWNVRTQNAFSLPFAAILLNCAPSGEMHNYCISPIIKENFENFLIHQCHYILLSQVYCVWQVVKTPTIILNNPVYNIGVKGVRYKICVCACACVCVCYGGIFVNTLRLFAVILRRTGRTRRYYH